MIACAPYAPFALVMGEIREFRSAADRLSVRGAWHHPRSGTAASSPGDSRRGTRASANDMNARRLDGPTGSPAPVIMRRAMGGRRLDIPGGQSHRRQTHAMIQRTDNVLIVVEDLEAVKAFFLELGLHFEGEATVEGPEVARLIGLPDAPVRATLATLRTPDGFGIELDKFHSPGAVRHGPAQAPVNAMGYRRVMFAVEGLDALVARMRDFGAEVIGEMRYEDSHRLAYIRGPEGIIVALAEQIAPQRAFRRQDLQE